MHETRFALVVDRRAYNADRLIRKLVAAFAMHTYMFARLMKMPEVINDSRFVFN